MTVVYPAQERSLRSCKSIAGIDVLTDESVCPTLVRKGLRFVGQALPPANRFVLQLLAVAARGAAMRNRIPLALGAALVGCCFLPGPPLSPAAKSSTVYMASSKIITQRLPSTPPVCPASRS